MSFRVRLAIVFVTALLLVQGVPAVLFYQVTRHALISEGERRLAVAGEVFARQLDDIAERVTNSVAVLSLDYALRAAVAQRDQGTVLSALRNHGRRVGAARMFLLDLDGVILADTLDMAPPGQPFPFADLVDSATGRRSSALVVIDHAVYLMIVVPVLAPVPIGWIAAALPVDAALLSRLQKLSALPQVIDLVTGGVPDGEDAGAGNWGDAVVAASSAPQLQLAAQLWSKGGPPPVRAGLPEHPVLARLDGREYVALAQPMRRSRLSAPVTVVLGYSLDTALRPYRPVVEAWLSLLAAGLVAGVAGALLIARGVSRPVELLAAAARRIEAGDYSPPAVVGRSDEIGQLATAFASMARVIAEREEHIRFQAEHDLVTGLFNRTAAAQAIERQLQGAALNCGALLMIGLGRLPEIVKTLGHAIADRVMQDAGRRARTAAPGMLVARANDTAFAVWAPSLDRPAAEALADRIVAQLAESYREADLALDTAPAAGLALYPMHGLEASGLLQRAEVALFVALGTDSPIVLYDPATDPHRPERLSLMADLQLAITRNELQLFFQPKVRLAAGTIDGVEALVRWRHPSDGLLPPDSFIGLAEETGNIRPLTRWILDAGADQARRWRDRGWRLRVAINLSARDLGDSGLAERVETLLAETDIPSDRLMLEITESAVMDEPEIAIGTLKRLADRGIDIAIDDFGIGQSSFAYLRRLPVHELKIDKSFIRHLSGDAADRTIVGSIVELGHRLGYRVTAEGIEDAESLAFLADIGCDYGQGYHIAMPLPADAFEQAVATSPWPVEREAPPA
jgi:EAL domain-containing protein (putative c-di-GMP-specific phosphodiesterase class I)/GGDEF domain-containing protein